MMLSLRSCWLDITKLIKNLPLCEGYIKCLFCSYAFPAHEQRELHVDTFLDLWYREATGMNKHFKIIILALRCTGRVYFTDMKDELL